MPENALGDGGWGVGWPQRCQLPGECEGSLSRALVCGVPVLLL